MRAMLALRKNKGRVLEPSCGNGAFSNHIPGCVAIEFDTNHAPPNSLNIDFFSYPDTEKFETIIGNPPYVRYQDIHPNTKAQLQSPLFDQRSNLYLFFIEKAVRHLTQGGELIFITPRDFLKNTASKKLNQWLYENGSITHAIDLGDARIFSAAVPKCLIWRYEKNRRLRTLHYAEINSRMSLKTALQSPAWVKRHLTLSAGQLTFADAAHSLYMHEIALVKVGAVSGADALYTHETAGNRDFVYAGTLKTGKTRRMIWVDKHDPPPLALLPHKNQLIARKIRPFNESNWWHWGRGYPNSPAPRVYVNIKTRQTNPFFLHPSPHFDGAILALFPLNPNIDLPAFCQALNAVDWQTLGFVCDGRFLFAQRSLANTPLPDTLRPFLPPK